MEYSIVKIKATEDIDNNEFLTTLALKKKWPIGSRGHIRYCLPACLLLTAYCLLLTVFCFLFYGFCLLVTDY